MPIGVFDSGLGGLTILDAIVRRLPDQDFVYLGDNLNAPYGLKSPAEVYNLTVAGVERLFADGCELVVLACNTASAVALHDLQVNWLNPQTHRVLGVFVPVIEHLTRRDWGDNTPPTHTGLRDVALFATPATVRSGAFPRELRFRARDVKVVPQACTGLVEAIEAGDLARAGGDRRRACRRPRRAPAGAAISRPWLHSLSAGRGRLSRRTTGGDHRRVPADADAASLADYLVRHPRFRGGGGDVSYLTTGDPAAVGARAAVFTGHPLPFAAPEQGSARSLYGDESSGVLFDVGGAVARFGRGARQRAGDRLG